MKNQLQVLIVILIVSKTLVAELSVNIYFFRMHRVSRQNILNIKRAMNDGMFLRKQVNEIFKLDVVGDVLLKYPLKNVTVETSTGLRV